MRFRFSLAVWGDWHIDQFIRHGLPSLKTPGNLDAIDYIISVWTRPADFERLKAVLEGTSFELRATIADDTGGWQEVANITIQSYAIQDIVAAGQAGEVWGLLAPDMVWSEGTFALYRKLLETGRKIIFRPLLRVDSDQVGTIQQFDVRHLAKMALENEHSVGQIYRADTDRFTTHPETIIWPAPDGRLHQTISADAVLFIANQASITPQFLCDEPFNDQTMAVIRDSDESVALAMCPANKHYEWQNGGGPLTPDSVRRFRTGFPSPTIHGLAQRPYRLHIGDTESSRWADVEQRANAFIAEVFK